MSHSTIIISRSILLPAAGETEPVVEATVTYRPPHGAGPKEIGKMVQRISRRMDSLADQYPDE